MNKQVLLLLVMMFMGLVNLIYVPPAKAQLQSPFQTSERHFLMGPLSDELGRDPLGVFGSSLLGYFGSKGELIPMLEGRISQPAEDHGLSLGLDLEGQFSTTHRNLSSFTANEFYFRLSPIWSGVTLFVGRKNSEWNWIDSRWGLVLWQPVYKVDPLKIHSQGLTGLFIQFGWDQWNLEIFGTPFFLPDHGPELQINEGEFIQGHPWVQYPPSEVVLQGQSTRVFYSIDRPSVPDVVINTGYGLNLRWGQSQAEGWMGRVAWAYKPLNQLLLGFDGNLNLSNSNRLEVGIHPEVGFHSLVSIDGSYRQGAWLFSWGVLKDQPTHQVFESPWTYQNFAPVQILGMGVQYQEGNWGVGMGWVHRQGGESQMAGPRANPQLNVLPERFQFRDWVQSEMSYQFRWSSLWANEVKVTWRVEPLEQSELLSVVNSVWMGPNWKSSVGVDLLRSNNRIQDSTDFIEANKNNDRYSWGIEYVF